MGGLGTCHSKWVTPTDGTRPVLKTPALQWPLEPRRGAQRNVPEASYQSPCPHRSCVTEMGTGTHTLAICVLPKGAERRRQLPQSCPHRQAGVRTAPLTSPRREGPPPRLSPLPAACYLHMLRRDHLFLHVFQWLSAPRGRRGRCRTSSGSFPSSQALS